MEKKKTKAVTEKPRTGRGGKRNFPNAKMEVKTSEDRALVSKLLTEVLTEYRQTKVKSDEELKERLSDYFARCAMNGQTPTVEEMAMCTGYTYDTVYDWETGRNHGFSPETSDIIKKSKNFMRTFDAKLVISGKMNFLAYCFRAKNYYGMVDKQEMVFTPNTTLGEQLSPEQLQKKYLEDTEIVSDSGIEEI